MLLFSLSGFCLFFALIPVTAYGILHEGVRALFCAAGVFSLAAMFFKRLIYFYRARGKIFRRASAGVFWLGALALFFVNLAMFWSAYFLPPPPDESPDALILGCQVQGSAPSLMLSRRLERGREYLLKNPGAIAVVSGGQDPGEDLPESEAMKKWLAARGVEESRIFEENSSHNTRENLEKSAGVFSMLGRGESIVLVSDNFHALRSRILAKRLGFARVYHLSSEGPWGLIPAYWVREYLGVLASLCGLY